MWNKNGWFLITGAIVHLFFQARRTFTWSYLCSLMWLDRPAGDLERLRWASEGSDGT